MSFSVIIPSRSTENLTACVRAILNNQPDLTPDRILVINDGLSVGDLMYAFGGSLPFTMLQGEKPFIYARNNNIGIRAAGENDVVLLNDDALLKTPNGFAILEATCGKYPEIGILSPSINNVGNTNQNPKGLPGVRTEDRMLCFSCVYIPRKVLNIIGGLDEDYIHYGLDDDQASWEVRAAGFKLAITDDVFVDHGSLKSEYRGKGSGDFRPNLRIFIRKWGCDNRGLTKEQSPFAELFD